MWKLAFFLAFCLVISFPATFHAEGQQNCEMLKNIFHTKVEAKDGKCSVEIVRKNPPVTHIGKKLSPETMELAFQFNFEKVSNQTAVIGELALLEDEVNPVLDELRKGKLEISALHNHMLHEKPRIMYIHFQGIGDMEQQALTIKRAIERTSQ